MISTPIRSNRANWAGAALELAIMAIGDDSYPSTLAFTAATFLGGRKMVGVFSNGSTSEQIIMSPPVGALPSSLKLFLPAPANRPI